MCCRVVGRGTRGGGDGDDDDEAVDEGGGAEWDGCDAL